MTLAAQPGPRHAEPGGPRLAMRLAPSDRDAVLAHLLRLDAADRRLRFMQASPDNAIASYVARIDFGASACFGCFGEAGELVALAEGLACDSHALRRVEVALSTDAGWRQRGLARLGVEAVEAWCAERGVAEILLHCDARNMPMRQLLRSIAATTTVEGGEVDAILRPNCLLH